MSPGALPRLLLMGAAGKFWSEPHQMVAPSELVPEERHCYVHRYYPPAVWRWQAGMVWSAVSPSRSNSSLFMNPKDRAPLAPAPTSCPALFLRNGILTRLSTETHNFDRMSPSWFWNHILPTPTKSLPFSSLFLTPPSPPCSWSKQDNLLLWLKVLTVHQSPFICSDPHQSILSTAIRGILKTWKCGSFLMGPQ